MEQFDERPTQEIKDLWVFLDYDLLDLPVLGPRPGIIRSESTEPIAGIVSRADPFPPDA